MHKVKTSCTTFSLTGNRSRTILRLRSHLRDNQSQTSQQVHVACTGSAHGSFVPLTGVRHKKFRFRPIGTKVTTERMRRATGFQILLFSAIYAYIRRTKVDSRLLPWQLAALGAPFFLPVTKDYTDGFYGCDLAPSSGPFSLVKKRLLLILNVDRYLQQVPHLTQGTRKSYGPFVNVERECSCCLHPRVGDY